MRTGRFITVGYPSHRAAVWCIGLPVLTAVFFHWCLVPIQIIGHSMEPGWRDGRLTMVNRLAYAWGEPRRGDVAVLRLADGETLVKRIIGLPGDRFAIHAGRVMVNGHPLVEPYILTSGSWEWPEELLPAGIFYAAGDNRAESRQMHVRRSELFGRLAVAPATDFFQP